jgi:hypothetical protein
MRWWLGRALSGLAAPLELVPTKSRPVYGAASTALNVRENREGPCHQPGSAAFSPVHGSGMTVV